jgi:hypothetical protein
MMVDTFLRLDSEKVLLSAGGGETGSGAGAAAMVSSARFMVVGSQL